MDDRVKPLPADPTAAFHAEQAAKQEAYAAARQQWADRLEQTDELAEEVTTPATPAPEAGSSEGETAAPPAARQRMRRTSRRSIDPRQSCFQFYDE
jgi:hypothetical protein